MTIFLCFSLFWTIGESKIWIKKGRPLILDCHWQNTLPPETSFKESILFFLNSLSLLNSLFFIWIQLHLFWTFWFAFHSPNSWPEGAPLAESKEPRMMKRPGSLILTRKGAHIISWKSYHGRSHVDYCANQCIYSINQWIVQWCSLSLNINSVDITYTQEKLFFYPRSF